MSKVVLKDIVPCRKADLMSGFHLILFHVNRVPPHLGIVYRQKYYSLTASECQIGIDFDPIWRLIRSKKIETIVIKIDSAPSQEFISAAYQSYEVAKPNQYTCLSPIKDYFNEYHHISPEGIQFVFDLIPKLYESNLIDEVRQINLTSESNQFSFELLTYTMSEIYSRIQELQHETLHV